jgi:uncharacterized protein (DUF1015 family)
MVKVLEFQGLIASPEIACEMVARPYDVVTRNDASQLSQNKAVT